MLGRAVRSPIGRPCLACGVWWPSRVSYGTTPSIQVIGCGPGVTKCCCQKVHRTAQVSCMSRACAVHLSLSFSTPDSPLRRRILERILIRVLSLSNTNRCSWRASCRGCRRPLRSRSSCSLRSSSRDRADRARQHGQTSSWQRQSRATDGSGRPPASTWRPFRMVAPLRTPAQSCGRSPPTLYSIGASQRRRPNRRFRCL